MAKRALPPQCLELVVVASMVNSVSTRLSRSFYLVLCTAQPCPSVRLGLHLQVLVEIAIIFVDWLDGFVAKK